MLHTLKPVPQEFNLLHIDYNEYIVDSLKAYLYDYKTHQM